MRRSTRTIFVILASLVSIALILGLLFVAGSAGAVTAWRTELDHYLRYEAGRGEEALRVREAKQALWPADFTRELGGPTYGDNPFYQVDYMPPGHRPGARPLPARPSDVWCVLLENEPTGGKPAVRQVVFVAHYEDLYNAAWVVHTGAREPFTPALAAGLRRIGCNLHLVP
jgi:hypothetical protein